MGMLTLAICGKNSSLKKERDICEAKVHRIAGKTLREWLLIKIKGMAYRIELRPLATAEVLEAYDWYELQRVGLEP